MDGFPIWDNTLRDTQIVFLNLDGLCVRLDLVLFSPASKAPRELLFIKTDTEKTQHKIK